MKTQNFSGTIIDVINRKICKGNVIVESGRIKDIRYEDAKSTDYILPGFIDAHIHIESSMLVPSEFAKIAVRHGTVATVSDPHEIGNVLGEEGIDYMIDNGKTVPFKFFFGCPSCVPATEFESAGAILNSVKVKKILAKKDIYYLSEMMNYPGVLHKHPDVLAKIKASLDLGKPVDGHAPGLMGEDAKKYFETGISTDHECFTLKEALFKLKLGVKILIREGSAAKNYEALHPILKKYWKECMFCSDDKHPHELLRGHINELVVRSLKNGYDLMDILTVASVNPMKHYDLDVGLLQKGDKADFIVVDNLSTMHVKETVIDGVTIYKEGKVRIKAKKAPVINRFKFFLFKTRSHWRNGELACFFRRKS
jgi:adenine deaminase